MAREFKLKIKRNGTVDATLYIHDDDQLEIVDADSGKPAQYLIEKLQMCQTAVTWARKYNATMFRITKVNGEEE